MKKACTVMLRILIGGVSLYCLVPLLITLFYSLLPPEALKESLKLFPGLSLRQYEQVLLQSPEYMIWFFNSLRITILTIGINLPLSMLAGYGFAKFDFRGKNALFFTYIILMLMPFQVTQVAQNLTLDAFGLINTLWAVILPGAFGAFGVFLITQYMRGIDNSLLEAARMEGMGELQIFVKIVVPLCRPAMAAMVILLFMECWSMVEQPIVFISDPALQPLSVELGRTALDLSMYAGGVIFLLLPLLIYLLGHLDLVHGIDLSSVK